VISQHRAKSYQTGSTKRGSLEQPLRPLSGPLSGRDISAGIAPVSIPLSDAFRTHQSFNGNRRS
jgi:hypothetical protein